MQDPGLIADAKKASIDLGEVDGDKLAKILQRAYSMPADVIKAANEAMNLTGSSSE